MVDAPQPCADDLYQKGDCRNQCKGDQGQFPVQVEDPGQQADDGEGVADQNDQCAGSGLSQLFDVVCDFREYDTGAVVVVIALWQDQELLKHQLAQIVDHFGGDAFHGDGADESGCPANNKDHYHQNRHQDDHFGIFFDETSVEKGF